MVPADHQQPRGRNAKISAIALETIPTWERAKFKLSFGLQTMMLQLKPRTRTMIAKYDNENQFKLIHPNLSAPARSSHAKIRVVETKSKGRHSRQRRTAIRSGESGLLASRACPKPCLRSRQLSICFGHFQYRTRPDKRSWVGAREVKKKEKWPIAGSFSTVILAIVQSHGS